MRLSVRLSVVLFLLFSTLSALARAQDSEPRVLSFSPTGYVKDIRQVRVVFTVSMVPFGSQQPDDPFEVRCSVAGRGRWADDRNWLYDFEKDLPAGMTCEFTLKSGVRSVDGRSISGQRRFTFHTGGPAVVTIRPWEGSEHIDEEQIFVLKLDGEVDEDSVARNAYFRVEGLLEQVGVRIVEGEERRQVLDALPRYDEEIRQEPVLLVRARRTFPPNSRVDLVWPRGIRGEGGNETLQEQTFAYKSRPAFLAAFTCQRLNSDRECIPFTPMRLEFSAPVTRETAARVRLSGPEGRSWEPELADDDSHVTQVRFLGPFPSSSTFTLSLPPAVTDDASRPLSNQDSFPITVRTDDYPPLVKFAADFGILEKAVPLLPVTVRNIEAELGGRKMAVSAPASLPGRTKRLDSGEVLKMLGWIQALRSRNWEDRFAPVLGGANTPGLQSFSLPKPNGPRAFEVVGIPLAGPGFYIVELESRLLGEALMDPAAQRPAYVAAAALVTNLSVHFKQGRESSLVWVTTLDQGQPVSGAAVEILDCTGARLASGSTQADGTLKVGKLEMRPEVESCGYGSLERGLVVTARREDDFSFVHTSWNEGIETWRFQVPTEWDEELITAHTIFDRTLVRAGETIHMKHLLRERATSGFTVPAGRLTGPNPASILVQHLGSNQTYTLNPAWRKDGSAESQWQVPPGARLGDYSVSVRLGTEEEGNTRHMGSFRVEEFRVPLMRAAIQGPSEELVKPDRLTLDLSAEYLAGGGAKRLPVRLRSLVRETMARSFPDYQDYVLANGAVAEGMTRRGSWEDDQEAEPSHTVRSLDLTLDEHGAARTLIEDLPEVEKPSQLFVEMEFRDPNGQVQTVADRIPLWSSRYLVGLQHGEWAASPDNVQADVVVIDLKGQPVAGTPVTVSLLERKTYSHRKRLVGGFYGYEHYEEVRPAGQLCSGRTDQEGKLSCQKKVDLSGRIILQAAAADPEGRSSTTHREIWVVGDDQWWFRVEDHDRIDLLPEEKRYEPGQTARFQVRMPFREATALITVEREGIVDVYVRPLSGREPVIDIPVRPNYAPNVFVSTLLVRGRTGEVQPTALVDLGKPAYRLGLAEIQVGWGAHELQVKVSTDRDTYRVRDKARVAVEVLDADGNPAPPGTEIALAVVDEGLLELMPNQSWNLLEQMMGRRACSVETSTAQMQVVGKRHFGLKALPSGGGGGRQATRELFDTLLFWNARIKPDSFGRAVLDIPLNDSLTSFRIAAVATAGTDRFGTGYGSLRTTQDLMIFSGIPPLVREGDRFRSEFTVRNASEKPLEVDLKLKISGLDGTREESGLQLGPGESHVAGWDVAVPLDIDELRYDLEATSSDNLTDRIKVVQKVAAALPERVLQATMTQLDKSFSLPVERPSSAVPGKGAVELRLQPKLVDAAVGPRLYMDEYPYTCLEQRISRAVVLGDRPAWERLSESLASHLDADGLAKYFPRARYGSDILTSYILAIAQERDWAIPEETLGLMIGGLQGFVEGRIVRGSQLPTVDLTLRKLSAVEALSRYEAAQAAHLASILPSPELWPTSALIDWFNILRRVPDIPESERLRGEAERLLRSRLHFEGTVMKFSTEERDHLWWLMISPDLNGARLILSLLGSPAWNSEMPRLVRGALDRQKHGHWDLTTANAWGVLALEKFSAAFEREPVSGETRAALAGQSASLNWQSAESRRQMRFRWPENAARLEVAHQGSGRPWLFVRSEAAIPLTEPYSAGFTILEKTITAVERKVSNQWSAGDILRVRLKLSAQTDMTWAVLTDPIPAGAVILGSGLGRDSELSTRGEQSDSWFRPHYEERSFESYRAYYDYVPKGEWILEYTFRLNTAGSFQLPPTRLEAMYAPEMFGEAPNQPLRVMP